MFAYSIWKATGFKVDFWPWYFSNVIVRVLGDDNRSSCSQAAAAYVSEQICADGYADFGHVYTNDEKNGLNAEFRSFEATTLLKRFTRFEPILQRYVAPLKIRVIDELPLWTRGEGKDLEPSVVQAIANVETAVRYLAFHDDATWNDRIPKWIKMFEHLGWKPQYLNRKQALLAQYNKSELSFFNIDL
jgi:hypothetical protein